MNPHNDSQEVSLSIGQVFFTWSYGQTPFVCKSITVKSKYIEYRSLQGSRKVQMRHICAEPLPKGSFPREITTTNVLGSQRVPDVPSHFMHTEITEVVPPPNGFVEDLPDPQEAFNVANTKSKAERVASDAARYKKKVRASGNLYSSL